MEKDPAVLELLAAIRERFGDSFQIIDHWKADRRAIGLAALRYPSRLVYILSRSADRYAVSLEAAPTANSDLPYEEIANYDDMDRKRLFEIFASHLGLSR